jgi:anti-anti-sigma factor
MSLAPFSANVRDGSDQAIIDLHGELNAGSLETLERAYDAAPKDGKVTLNFSDVSYINSSGIGVIVGLLAHARNDGRAVNAYGLSDHYQQIFRITRIADYIEMFQDEASALAGARSA